MLFDFVGCVSDLSAKQIFSCVFYSYMSCSQLSKPEPLQYKHRYLLGIQRTPRRSGAKRNGFEVIVGNVVVYIYGVLYNELYKIEFGGMKYEKVVNQFFC